MPTVLKLYTSAKALAVDIPILTPVKEPGPIEHASKSISFNVKLVFVNILSINGINVCECVFSSSLCNSAITLLSSNIQVVHLLEDVSIPNIFIKIQFLSFLF